MRDHPITHGRDPRGRPHHHHPSLERARGLHGRGGEGHGRGHGHRGRLQTRRGAVRDAVLRVLADQPAHGYQLMQELTERSGGRWRPSAGSIYPTLQQLEDEGLVVAREHDGRRVFELTESGRTAVAALSSERPWPGRQDGGRDLHRLAREVGMAALQVGRMGSDRAVADAATILAATRRDLYRLLADEPVADAAPVDGKDPAAQV